jgi:heterodisulfide reductase subunit C
MSEPFISSRSVSLRKLILIKTGQDVSRCRACQFCDGIPSHEMDIPLTSLIQLINLNDDEVLTSKTLWSEEVLQHAEEACSRQLNLEAIILALRSEAVQRGLVSQENLKETS